MKNLSKPPMITIRGLPVDKQKRIQELAKESGQSMNSYLLNILFEVAERHEIMMLDSKYSELQKETLLALTINTEELKQVQQLVKYVMGGEAK